MRHILLILLSCSLHIFSSVSVAQGKFYATATPDQAHKDELITYRIVLENSAGLQQVTPPSFTNFILISGPNQESGMTNINGKVTSYLAMGFILQPKKSGSFTIPPARITVNGKILQSNEVKLYVDKTVSGNNNMASVFSGSTTNTKPRSAFNAEDFVLRKGENVTEKVKRNMLMKLELNKHTCYVGEPVTATYKLYSRLKSDSRLVVNPSFNGFSVIDLQAPDPSQYDIQKLQGKDFNVYTIRKAQLYPLQAGTFPLGSAELENTVQFVNANSELATRDDLLESLDAFGNALYDPADFTTATINVSNLPENIVVKPLPELNKPASFSGAVGQFSIKASIKNSTIAVNETGCIAITITGKGNLQLVTEPNILWPNHMESFDPKTIDQFQMNAVPVTGSRTFEFTFSVDSVGNFIIPPVTFSYFDPVKEIYTTLQTEPSRIAVVPSKNSLPANIPVSNNSPSFLNAIIEKRNVVILIIALLMLSGLLIYILQSRKKIQQTVKQPVIPVKESKTEKKQYSDPLQPFALSEHCLQNNDCVQFYAFMQTDLKNYLADKLSVSPGEITADLIDAVLEQKNVPVTNTLQLKQLMQEIEWQLYTPFERNEKMGELYSKAQAVVQCLNLYL